MTILDKIVAQKRKVVAQSKANISRRELERFPLFERATNSLKQTLLADAATGIIAEFKRRSPSKGVINDRVQVHDVTLGYVCAGASGLSVLTDEEFFFGTEADFKCARQTNPDTPLLRKEFMIDEYQVIEAKAWGADVILLIAACLTPAEIDRLGTLAQSLGMEVLLEVHDAEELNRSLSPHVDLIGVNNRNLKTFEVRVETSLELAGRIPAEFVRISESGLSHPETLHTLHTAGYRGFLMGETFMKTDDPAKALAALVGAYQHQPVTT
jgi:indole-3-glycerol phosphate synthase